MAARPPQPADFAALSLDPRDRYLVIGGRSVPHPGNDGGLGPLLDWNPLGSGHCTASHRSGMLRDGLRQPLGQ
jgi:hypothetical protein